MKKVLILGIAALLLVMGLVAAAPAVSANDGVTVPGTACVYFAGQTQPDLEAAYPPSSGWETVRWDVGGAGTHANFHNDTADWECRTRAGPTPINNFSSHGTAVVPPFIEVCSGGTLSIVASGTWGHGPAHPSGPGGKGASDPTHAEYDDLGISLVAAELNTLIGVFLTDDPPNPAATPSSLTSPTTTPALQQAFAIGASLADITIPDGATRLFFGLQDGYEWWNNGGSVTVSVTMICPVIEVEIDIKPGSDPNSINLGDRGVLPVAILGTEDFDVSTIDPGTIEIGGITLATRGPAKAPKLAYSYEDVNEDGYMDLVAFFGVQQLVEEGVLTDTTTELVLTAYTYDDVPITGGDFVRVVPPE
ncbi:hypothetical protein ES703_03003 [subsurface metagenome]